MEGPEGPKTLFAPSWSLGEGNISDRLITEKYPRRYSPVWICKRVKVLGVACVDA